MFQVLRTSYALAIPCQLLSLLLGNKYSLEIRQRPPSDGKPYNGFGFYGHSMVQVMKKMYFVGNFLNMGLGSLVRSMLPNLNREVGFWATFKSVCKVAILGSEEGIRI